MRLLFFLFFLFTFFYPAYSSETNTGNTGDSLKIKDRTKEDFMKEFGFNDSARALINVFFARNQRAKNQAIIGSACLIGGTVALAVPFEQGDDQKGFGDLVRPVADAGAVMLGVIVSVSGITKLGKYSKQKLYMLLANYKKEIPIPQKYRKKIKRKFFT